MLARALPFASRKNFPPEAIMDRSETTSSIPSARSGALVLRRRWALLAIAVLTLATASMTRLGLHAAALDADNSSPATLANMESVAEARVSRVAGRGRLEPAGGVIHIAGPARQLAVVAELQVREGDWVEAGQTIAVLDGLPALRATVQRLEAMARHAQSEAQRFAPLCREGIASAIECDAVRMRLDTARADLAHASADVDTCYVRAPQAGRILRVHADAGERVDSNGIVEMGDTRHMEVVAEIYETDVPLLRRGQVARISSSVLEEALVGSVERIGLSVHKQSVFDVDPVANADARIIEARIRVADAERVANLTNLQVEVEVEVGAVL